MVQELWWALCEAVTCPGPESAKVQPVARQYLMACGPVIESSSSARVLAMEEDLFVHQRLVEVVTAMLRSLLGTRTQDVVSVGFCWPEARLRVEGKPVAFVVVSLPENDAHRRRCWLRAIHNLRPFALLQITPLEDGAHAFFESKLGLQEWKLHGEERLSGLEEVAGVGLGLLRQRATAQ